jgi:hypothetical protein
MKAAGFEYWVVRNPLEPPEIEFPFGIDNMAWAKSNGFGRELTTRISTNEQPDATAATGALTAQEAEQIFASNLTQAKT